MLNNGYIVRGSTRSKHSADALVKGVYAGFRDRVEFVEVRDITAEGAFDEAVRGEQCLFLLRINLKTLLMIAPHMPICYVFLFIRTLQSLYS